MKISITDYDSGEVYAEINDPTASQIASYSSCDVITMNDQEYIVKAIIMEHENQVLDVAILLVSE